MNKKLLILSLVSIISFFSLAQNPKAALISVSASRNLSGNPLETQLYAKIMKSYDYDIRHIVNNIESVVEDSLKKCLALDFVSKETVIKNPRYIELLDSAKSQRFKWTHTCAQGFVPVTSFSGFDDKDAIAKAFEIYDVDVIMVAYITFQNFETQVSGAKKKLKVNGDISLRFYNREGKKITKIHVDAVSNSSVMTKEVVFTDLEVLMPLIEEAAKNLILEMKTSMPKKIKKKNSKF